MGTRDFMPTRDLDLEAWAGNFSNRITATPTAYGLTAADATLLASFVADYGARLASAINPATRTVVTISAKDISRSALKARIRTLARFINAHPQTTNPQREELGLCLRGRIVGPTPAPATRPNVSVSVLGGLQSGILLSDELAPARRARPPGVRGAYLWGKIDGPAPAGTRECQFLGTASRTRHVITHPPTAIHKTVWIVAQWVNDRGETGPISLPASASVAA